MMGSGRRFDFRRLSSSLLHFFSSMSEARYLRRRETQVQMPYRRGAIVSGVVDGVVGSVYEYNVSNDLTFGPPDYSARLRSALSPVAEGKSLALSHQLARELDGMIGNDA